MRFPIDKAMVLRIRKWSRVQRINMGSHSVVTLFWHDSITLELFFVLLLFLL